MIRVSVSIDDEVSALLSEFSDKLGENAKELTEPAGIAARNAAIEYHDAYDKRGGWRGKRYLDSGTSSGFGADVTRGWKLESFDKSGAVISNDANNYAFKVDGGTITPKRAKALTIPLIPEAKGLRAAVYSQNTGNRLFTIKGKHALFERVGGATTGSRGRRQAGATRIRTTTIRAVYALVRSVTQQPWPGALPPDDVIQDAYAEEYENQAIRILES